MDKDDRLMEELLKEHARKGSGADEDFLKDLEDRIDAEDKVVVMQKKDSPGNRWALSAGIAACLALGVGGIYFWQERQGDADIIAYDSTATEQIAAQSEPPVAYSEKKVAEAETVQEKPEVANMVARKPSAPSGAMAKVIGSKEASPTPIPVPEQALPEPSLDFGNGDGFGAGWGSGNGQGSGGADGFAAPAKVKRAHKGDVADIVYGRDVAQGERLATAHDYTKFNAQVQEYEKARTELSNLRLAGADNQKILKQQLEVNEQRNRLAVMSQKTGIPYMGQPKKPELSREQYGKLVENRFVAPVDERSALSTFAVDVDTASYANVRRMINEGMQIPKDSVRVEEMINYFDYQYAQPEGEHPFAVQVDSAACPWNEKHRIVRIGVQGKDIIREQRPPANLVFLLDVSGSMNSPNKLPLLKQSMNFLLEELNEKDSVSIVVYAGAIGLALPATKMDDTGRQQVADAMEKLSAGGSTAGGQGIKLAYQVAKEQFKKDGINRIILATDGDFNVGVSDTDSLTKMVKEKAKEGTYLSVLGFGSGNINDNMLESITNSGNGNYSYIDTVKEGRKVLLEDMMGTMVTIAKDVKVQVVMNPKKVKAYRLIGYANRMLPPEAFLDKKVDAGEIGAGHTVTALYEIIPADGKPFGPEIDGSRYFEKPEEKPNPAIKDSDETMFVKLAYKKPDQKMDDESTYFSVPFADPGTGIKEASADLKFASAVGLFGMVLRDSEYKGSGDLNTVMELATAGKGPDGKGLREEFIKLVQKLNEKE
ncbi:von Willebrand factor type A domain-containing protein [Rubritalea squalenifaciens DSM 18772]|uniref:von Willebrand factor type A domain-containing protein n=1 Tax=Rubritalea squalenifaciens DSM 18772 TaxID=1123071 RepID=A0A1M6PIR8_9BACT|nr:VWA domain-containing protein [Rubritalea squalenifaciens]SHK07842.1 von Willebrand factor type A domain-containing protein [Rubritalea squalenifaciens DSM 18772]